MTTVESTKRRVFVLLLASIAVGINCLQRPSLVAPRPALHLVIQPPSPQADVARIGALPAPANAPNEAATQQAQEIARYINSGFSRRPDMKAVAIVSVSEDGSFNDSVASAIAAKLKNDSMDTEATFFTPEFVSDGLFAQALGGSRALWARLDLGKSLDGILLASQSVTYSTNASLENVVSAAMQLQVKSMPGSPGRQAQAWEFEASGAGFNPAAARAMAQERLIKKIGNDTNLVLNQ